MKTSMDFKYSYLLGKSSKIDKSDKYTDYQTFVMYLAPSDVSGTNVCQYASEGCRSACLYTSGRGRFNSTQQARVNRTLHYVNDRVGFLVNLTKEITKLHKKHGKLAIRLNGTSDINWMPYIRKMHKLFPTIVWYDYTKNPLIAKKSTKLDYYHVTFSRSEDNWNTCEEMLDRGVNVAAVFNGKQLPPTFKGYKVINGDKTDARFLDDKGVIVGLLAKGDGKKDTTGFVIDSQLTI